MEIPADEINNSGQRRGCRGVSMVTIEGEVLCSYPSHPVLIVQVISIYQRSFCWIPCRIRAFLGVVMSAYVLGWSGLRERVTLSSADALVKKSDV
jgi:hypothetical protein